MFLVLEGVDTLIDIISIIPFHHRLYIKLLQCRSSMRHLSQRARTTRQHGRLRVQLRHVSEFERAQVAARADAADLLQHGAFALGLEELVAEAALFALGPGEFSRLGVLVHANVTTHGLLGNVSVLLPLVARLWSD